MKITAIADKIMTHLVKEVVDTGHDSSSLDALAEEFPDIPRHQLILAVNLLRSDKLLTVHDVDDEPQYLFVNPAAIRLADENTLIKKGYAFLKEVRQWF